MKMKLGITAALLSSFALAPAVVSAQSHDNATWGLLGALNLSTITNSGPTDNRVGFDVGAFVQKPIGGVWSFRGEAHYTEKGLKSTEGGGEMKLNLGYIEVPLLLRATASRSEGMNPFFEVGPALAAKVSCNFSSNGGGATVSFSCDNVGAEVKSFDVGVLGGVGVEFPAGPNAFSVAVRYNLGLLEVAKDSDANNRNLQFVLGFRFK